MAANIAEACGTIDEALEQLHVIRRTETAEDYPFLERLYISVRWQELQASGWPVPARLEFLCSQFALQHHHYQTHYAGTDFAILERDGAPIGRIYLFHGPDDIRVVDISLLDEVRGQGIGGAALAALIRQAEREGKSVSIHVEKFNPAQNLYRRLGFREAGESGPYWRMVHPAGRSN